MFTACLMALKAIPVEAVQAAATTPETHQWAIATATVATAGAALASKKAMRRAMRKAAWQQIWYGRRRKVSIESPEFLWVAIILGAVGLLAALFGLGLLAGITLGCAVLCLIRSFF
jgi:Tfp pilus assembly protein FimV